MLNDNPAEALIDDPEPAAVTQDEGFDLPRYGLYALLVAANVLVIGACIGFYRSRRRRLQQAPDEELETLLANDPAAAEKTALAAKPEDAPDEKSDKAQDLPVATFDEALSVEALPVEDSAAEAPSAVEDSSAEDKRVIDASLGKTSPKDTADAAGIDDLLKGS